jgi:hypothetical protein
MATVDEIGGSDNIRDTHWLGKVVENKDPLKNGRCKVMVFGKFDNVPAEDIPWAACGNRNAVGAHAIPNVGDIVSIRFDNGNLYHPEYFYQVNQRKALKSEVLDSLSEDEAQQTISLVYDEIRNIRIYHSPKDGIIITRGKGAKERPLIQIDEKNNIKISTDTKIFLDSGNIFLSNTGEGSEDEKEPAVRGVSLEKWLNTLLDDYQKHIHPTPTGPSGPPSPPTPATIGQLKGKHKDYQQKGK